jgi:hypothetical protein
MADDDNTNFNNEKFYPVLIGGDGKGPGTRVEEQLSSGEESPPKQVFQFSATDNLANQSEAVISVLHVPSGESIFFKAFITAFSDSISPSYNEETVFGRTDSIYTYQSSRRNITINWKIPAETYSEAYENLAKAQKLAQFPYPSYTDINNAATISQTSLCRLKIMNLLAKSGPVAKASNAAQGTSDLQKFNGYRSSKDPSQGALGVIKSITILHNIENPDAGGGVLYLGKNTVLPKLIEINMSFDVIHEQTLGWQNGNFKNNSFPFKTVDVEEITEEQLNNIQTFNELIERERQNQANIDNAQARYSGAFSEARKNKDMERIAALERKDNLNDRQQKRLDYLRSARDGQIALESPDINPGLSSEETVLLMETLG